MSYDQLMQKWWWKRRKINMKLWCNHRETIGQFWLVATGIWQWNSFQNFNVYVYLSCTEQRQNTIKLFSELRTSPWSPCLFKLTHGCTEGNLATRPFREPFGLQSAFPELSSCTSKLPSKPYSQVTQLHGITLIKLCQHITGHTACKVLYCTSSKVMAFHEAAVSWARKHLGRYYFRFTDDVDILSLLPCPFRLEYTDSYRSPYQMEPLFSCSTTAFVLSPDVIVLDDLSNRFKAVAPAFLFVLASAPPPAAQIWPWVWDIIHIMSY